MKLYPNIILILLLCFSINGQQKVQTPVVSDGDADDSAIVVRVQVLIDEYGNVRSAKALSGAAEFRKPSVEAALKMRFKETILRGQAVRVTGVVVFTFNSNAGLEDVGRRLALLEDGLPDKESVSQEDEKTWNDLPEEKPQFKALLTNNSADNRSASASDLITVIREKLKTKNPASLWEFDLGYTIAKLQNSAENEAKLKDFQALLQEFAKLIETPVGNLPNYRKDKLSQILKFSKTENLSKDNLKEIVKLLAISQPYSFKI